MNMKKYIVTLTLLAGWLMSHPSGAQNVSLNWGKALGIPMDFSNSDVAGFGNALAIDANRNIYSGGMLSAYPPENVDFGSGIVLTAGLMEAFVAKHDENGNCIWARNYPAVDFFDGSDIRAIAPGADDFLYVSGTLMGGVIFSPTDTVTDPNGANFILKLDTAGNFVWVKTFAQLTLGGHTIFSMVADKDGNLYVAGDFTGTVDFDPDPLHAETLTSLGTGGNSDLFVCKLDSTGAYVWAKSMGGLATGSRATARSLAVDAESNIYITGAFRDEIDFNPAGGNLLTAGPTQDPFVCKLTSAGDLVWVRQFECTGGSGSSSGGIGVGLSLDARADVFVTGYFYQKIDFDASTSFDAQGTSTYDMFVARLDSAGNLAWARQIGGDGYVSPNAITTDEFDQVYTTGSFLNGSADFDPGADPYVMTPVSGPNTFVSKLDKNGNFRYAFQLEGTNNTGKGIAVVPSGVFLAGTFRGTADLDPTATTSQVSTGVYDAGFSYFASYRDCPDLDTLSGIRGPDTVCAGESYVFSTPPVAGAVSYTWHLPAGWTGSSTVDSIRVTTGTAGGEISVVANGICDVSIENVFSVHVNTLSVSIDVKGDTLSTSQADYASWQWYLDGVAISQAAGASHVAEKNGDYTVVVTDRFGCTDTSDAVTINHIPEAVSGLGMDKAVVSVYPNPVSGTLYVRLPLAGTLHICAADGKVFLINELPAVENTPVDLSLLPAGMYILTVTDGAGRLFHREKLVKIAK
jgi:hypothetical protein